MLGATCFGAFGKLLPRSQSSEARRSPAPGCCSEIETAEGLASSSFELMVTFQLENRWCLASATTPDCGDAPPDPEGPAWAKREWDEYLASLPASVANSLEDSPAKKGDWSKIKEALLATHPDKKPTLSSSTGLEAAIQALKQHRGQPL